MKGIFARIRTKFKNNISNLKIEGLTTLLILVFFIFLTLTNIVRIFTNGQSNYSTYLLEKAELEKIKNKNEELKSQLEYSNSDENKILSLRDALNVAQSDQELIRIREQSTYYQEKKQLLDLRDKEEYSEWWRMLFGI